MRTEDNTMQHRFDLICFDWDGTLFDSTNCITLALQQAVVDVGGARPTREQASYVIGLGLLDALRQVAPDVPLQLIGHLLRIPVTNTLGNVGPDVFTVTLDRQRC